MRINYLGSVYSSRAALPYMREAGGGRLVFVSSMAGSLSLLSLSLSLSLFLLSSFSLSLSLFLLSLFLSLHKKSVYSSRAALPYMREAGGGRLVFVSSMAGSLSLLSLSLSLLSLFLLSISFSLHKKSIYSSRAALPYMRETSGGRLVFVSSFAGSLSLFSLSLFSFLSFSLFFLSLSL